MVSPTRNFTQMLPKSYTFDWHHLFWNQKEYTLRKTILNFELVFIKNKTFREKLIWKATGNIYRNASVTYFSKFMYTVVSELQNTRFIAKMLRAVSEIWWTRSYTYQNGVKCVHVISECYSYKCSTRIVCSLLRARALLTAVASLIEAWCQALHSNKFSIDDKKTAKSVAGKHNFSNWL